MIFKNSRFFFERIAAGSDGEYIIWVKIKSVTGSGEQVCEKGWLAGWPGRDDECLDVHECRGIPVLLEKVAIYKKLRWQSLLLFITKMRETVTALSSLLCSVGDCRCSY